MRARTRGAFVLAAAFSAHLLAAQDPRPLPAWPSGTVARAVVQLVAIGSGEAGKNHECSATGLLVNEQGYLVTNAHVYDRAMECLAASPGTKIMAKLSTLGSRVAPARSCDLVALDRVHDLALLKTERLLDAGNRRRETVSLDPSGVPVGASVMITGHPVFAWLPVTRLGTVLGRAQLPLGETGTATADAILLDIALETGSSGSPVYLRDSGSVIGIIEGRNPSARSQTVAVPTRYVIELLGRCGVRWQRARP